MVAHVSAPFRSTRPRPKRTWDYKDWQESVEFFRANAPEQFESEDTFIQNLREMQDATGVQMSCRMKSRYPEPPAIKDIRALIRSNIDPRLDIKLRSQLWKARKSWLRELQEIHQVQQLERGKPILKRKNLKAITSMTNHGVITIDFGVASQWVQNEFEAKWKSHDLHRNSIAMDELDRLSGSVAAFSAGEWTTVVEVPTKQRALDEDGVCLAAFRVALAAAPVATATLLNSLFNNDAFFKSEVVSGRAFAKKDGSITPQQVRAITPLPCVLTVFDCMIDRQLRQCVDTFASALDGSYMETAVAGRQILDTTFALSQHVEKTLDMHGEGCVAAADIRAYFDNLDPLRISRWLLRRGFPPALAAGLLRLHCLPSIELTVGSAIASIKSRTCGFFTGTRTAGTAARIPLLDAAHERGPVWSQHSACYNGMSFSVTSFVDNVYSTGSTAVDAVAVLKDLELFLNNKWRLHFGEDSKEMLPTEGCIIEPHVLNGLLGWTLKRSMRCLGQILASNGSIEEDFSHAKTCMWASFWANFGPALRRAPKHAKLRFLQGCVRPIASFKWSRWPWQPTYAKKLDQLQTHMLSLVFPCAPVLNEDSSDFFRRRSLNAGRLASSMGRWGAAWARSSIAWHDHVVRAHDTKNWCHYIYSFHGHSWLEAQRLAHSRAGETNRTCTRASRAKVTRRWFEGHADALWTCALHPS